jgi:hypothetical protein
MIELRLLLGMIAIRGRLLAWLLFYAVLLVSLFVLLFYVLIFFGFNLLFILNSRFVVRCSRLAGLFGRGSCGRAFFSI